MPFFIIKHKIINKLKEKRIYINDPSNIGALIYLALSLRYSKNYKALKIILATRKYIHYCLTNYVSTNII